MNDHFEQDDLTSGTRKNLSKAGGQLFKFLRKKGLLKKVLISVIPFLLIVAVIYGTGLTAVVSAKSFFDDIKNFFGGAEESVQVNGQASDILALFDEGFEPDAQTLDSMRLDLDTFHYLLTLANSYNNKGATTRSITIQGKLVYTTEEPKQVPVTPEAGDPNAMTSEWETTTVMEPVEHTEYPEFTIEVSNSDTEGMLFLDWRRLYFYSLFASLDNDSAEEAGKITKMNVADAYNAIAMRYDYAFDIMTDGQTSYSFEDCQQLPHTLSVSGDPSTESGELTVYYPTSLMNYAYSGHSRLVYTVDESMSVTGIEEYYDPGLYAKIGSSLSSYYSDDLFDTYCSLFPGGRSIKEQFDYYDYCYEHGNPVIYRDSFSFSTGDYSLAPESYEIGSTLPENEGTALLPSFDALLGGNGLVFNGDVLFESPQTVGEAAVNLALSRLHWGYSQPLRMAIGYWDCSSMVSRVYSELGVDIPSYGTTITLRDNAYLHGQIVEMSTLQPGDVLWFSNSGGRHVVMWAGNGMIVHAKSSKSGTVYEPLDKYLSETSKTLYFAMRPYKGVANTWTQPTNNKLDNLILKSEE